MHLAREGGAGYNKAMKNCYQIMLRGEGMNELSKKLLNYCTTFTETKFNFSRPITSDKDDR